MPGSFPPRLFGLAAVEIKTYLAVHMVVDEFEGVTHLNLWDYAGGSFSAEVAVLDLVAEGLDGESREQYARTIGYIAQDPAGLVGDGSIYWDDGGAIVVFDPSAPAVYQHGVGEGFHCPPIWHNGWLWYLTFEGDTDERRLRRIRADGTSDQLISNHESVDDFHEGHGLVFLTPLAMHAYGTEIIVSWPLDGSTPVETVATGQGAVPASPFRNGTPAGSADSIYLLTTGSEVQAWRFSGPNSHVALWPTLWADWADPGGSGAVLSQALSPNGSALVVYAAGRDGQPDRGILRVDTGVQVGPAPNTVLVEEHEGAAPDFMFPRD